MLRAQFVRNAVAAVAMAMTASLAAAQSSRTVDEIYINGRFWTGRVDNAYVQAVAVSGERIVAVGTTAEISARRTATTRVVDLGGQFVTPGLIDTHVHFINGGFALQQVDLRDAATPAEFSR